MFYLVDNHAAMLCSSLLHSEVVESLCYSEHRSTPLVADKSRILLVEFLRTLAHILPERNCAELLNAPSLIEFSTSIHAGAMSNRAHKARQLLSSLADAFNVAPRQFRVSPTEVRGNIGLTTLMTRYKMNQSANTDDGTISNNGSMHSGVLGERIASRDDGNFYLFQFAGAHDSDSNELGQLPLCAVGEHLKQFVDPMVSGIFLRNSKGSWHGDKQNGRRGSIRRINVRGDDAIEARKVTDGYIYYPENSPRSAYSSGGSTMGRPSGGNEILQYPRWNPSDNCGW